MRVLGQGAQPVVPHRPVCVAHHARCIRPIKSPNELTLTSGSVSDRAPVRRQLELEVCGTATRSFGVCKSSCAVLSLRYSSRSRTAFCPNRNPRIRPLCDPVAPVRIVQRAKLHWRRDSSVLCHEATPVACVRPVSTRHPGNVLDVDAGRRRVSSYPRSCVRRLEDRCRSARFRANSSCKDWTLRIQEAGADFSTGPGLVGGLPVDPEAFVRR
jgi:hypothetical protein